VSYAIVKQRDVNPDDNAWAESDGGIPIVHHTLAGAERAMAGMVPPGADPLVHAGLRVRQVLPTQPVIDVE
jgi:hypothetical protein